MIRYQIIIRDIIYFICLFSFLYGCDGKTEPLPKPKVITGKIIFQAADMSKKTTDLSATKAADLSTAKAPDLSTAKAPDLSLPEKSETKKDVSVSVAKESGIKPGSEISMVQKGTTGKQVSIPVVEKDEKKEPKVIAYSYDPKGKIDPFMQWFKEESPDSSVVKMPIEKRIPLTPLEKLDWSQLKLVGIIRASSGNRALVEETSGKGYVIKKGTYIGPHRGKVTKILKDKVIIEEVVEYGISKSSVREKELTLQKPPGEE